MAKKKAVAKSGPTRAMRIAMKKSIIALLKKIRDDEKEAIRLIDLFISSFDLDIGILNKLDKADQKVLLDVKEAICGKEIKQTKKKAPKKPPSRQKPPPRPLRRPKFVVGSFVKLTSSYYEDDFAGYGQVYRAEPKGMYTIKLHEKYRISKDDDLLRLVREEQLEYCLHPQQTMIAEAGTLYTYHCIDCGRTWDIDTSG